jgi:hypothetical protein
MMHKLNLVETVKSTFARYRENFTQWAQQNSYTWGSPNPNANRYIDMKNFNQYVIRYMDNRAKQSGRELTNFWANFKVAPKMDIEISLEMLYRGMCIEYGEDKANSWLGRLISGFLGLQEQLNSEAVAA